MENMEDMKFCQSCAMPITEELYGTEEDGSLNDEYCKYCYQDGEFTTDCTMEEMIEMCIPLTVEHSDMDEQSVTLMLNKVIPELKRWKKD
ncbi:MAG: zinc ribbon domain-containing protein [Methanosphaera sp.]|nr:zinc ribbon domain-containing protein [Methanosphaera sp.]